MTFSDIHRRAAHENPPSQFPGERGGGSGRPIKERNETGVWTLADILARVLLKQREWYWNVCLSPLHRNVFML